MTNVGTDDDEARIEALLWAMTLEEKATLLAGARMWTTPPVERLGIPTFKVTDEPNGARGEGGLEGGEVSAACFPPGIALAATWDADVVERVGKALAEEAKTKGAHVLLGPTVNIHRSPLSGRNFECYSEDPYLTSRLAVAYTLGLQREHIGAAVKHFVCNDSEFERNTISSEVDERTMREIYRPPFEAGVREADTWTVMSAYNKNNGVYAGENELTLTSILKDEWGFDGVVMSDWFGTNSTAPALNNGLDLEMPGPPNYRGPKLLDALASGKASEEAVDEAARRMLRLIMRAGAFERPELQPERAEDRPEHRDLICAAAADGIVLLKNEGDRLPLKVEELSSLAIIGPNARTAQIMGGGSAQVNAHYKVSPYEGVAAAVGDRVALGYEIGCTNHKLLPGLEASLTRTPAGDEPGFAVEYFSNRSLAGEAVHRSVVVGSQQAWFGHIAPGVEQDDVSARLTTIFTPAESGEHTLGIASIGLSRLFLDGREVIDNWTRQTQGDTYFGFGSTEVTASVEMNAGQSYELTLEYSSEGASLLAGVKLELLPPVAADSIERAAKLASE